MTKTVVAVHIHGAPRDILGDIVVISLSALWHFSAMYELPSLFDGKRFMDLYNFISSFCFSCGRFRPQLQANYSLTLLSHFLLSRVGYL
jgi:hypothetical protein